jgi:hypothetical protein
LLAAAAGTSGQEAKDASRPAEETAGPRLRVRFLETRQRGDKATSVPVCSVLLHSGDKGAFVFVGTQVGLRTSDRAAPAVMFKNAGVQVEVRAAALPDGRYRLDASFEEGSVLGAGGGEESSGEGNPVLQVVKAESQIVVREGETVPFASAVDPLTGEVVRVDVVAEAASEARVSPAAGGPDARLRARLVLHRRHGGTTIASRPYSVILPASEEKQANVFGGAMLPLEVTAEGRTTVMLRDVGAGVRLGARRLADGRHRVDLSLSDGTLAATSGSPRVQAFKAESRLYLREGETVVVASAVDPRTGDVVEAELTIEAAR